MQKNFRNSVLDGLSAQRGYKKCKNEGKKGIPEAGENFGNGIEIPLGVWLRSQTGTMEMQQLIKQTNI